MKGKLFYCDLCNYQAAKKFNIYIHIKQVHIVEQSKCQECKRIFKNPTKLKNHQRWHMRKNSSYSNMSNSKKFECSICSTQFTFYHGLQAHVEDFHSSEIFKIVFTCDLCNLKFFSKLFMSKHMSFEHSGPYGCLDRNCMKRFVNTRTRREHFKTTHNCSFDGDLKRLEIKRKDFYAFPYKCLNTSCERRFKNRIYMVNHHQTHSQVGFLLVLST